MIVLSPSCSLENCGNAGVPSASQTIRSAPEFVCLAAEVTWVLGEDTGTV